MQFSEVLQAVLVLPFTAGSTSTGKEKPIHYDGTTATTVISIFFFSFIFLLVKTVVEQKVILIPFVAFKIVLSFIVIIGYISCLVITVILKVKGRSTLMIQRPELKSLRLQKLFLWMFGIASMVYVLMKSGRTLECKELSIISIHAQNAEFAYYVLILLFLPVQMFFLTYHSSYTFKKSLRIQYAILLVIAADLTMWMYGLRDNDHDDMIIDNTELTINCTNQTFTRMLDVSHNILPPVFLEYAMLAISMMHNLLPNWEKSDHLQETQYETFQINEASFGGEEESTSFTDSRTPLLQSHLKRSTANKCEADRILSVENRKGMKVSFLFFTVLLFSSVLAIGIFSGYLLLVTEHTAKFELWVPILETLYASCMFFCTIAGYYFLVRDTTPPQLLRPVSGSEYVFILSSIGTMLGGVFRIMTAIQISQYAVVISRILWGCLSYTQTVFIIHAHRCRQKQSNKVLKSLKQILVLLALYNFGLWIVESFILGGFPNVEEVEKKQLGLDLWEIRVDVFHPMSVFYRFASALELYDIYKTF